MENRTQKGFTLIEAMVATMVMGIGFVGSFTLVGVVQQATRDSIVRQELQLQASQILDLIEADRINIAQYNNMNLAVCAEPDEGTTALSILRRYDWCRRLNDVAGDPLAGDTRTIRVTEISGNYIVDVVLQSGNGSTQIAMKRMYD